MSKRLDFVTRMETQLKNWNSQKTFDEIRAASELAAEQMQAGMETAWKSMQKTLKRVSSDLRK